MQKLFSDEQDEKYSDLEVLELLQSEESAIELEDEKSCTSDLNRWGQNQIRDLETLIQIHSY